MELKKTKKADLVRFKGLFMNIGLTISILIVILAFEWKSYDDFDLMKLGQLEVQTPEIIELPITKQPPPPTPVIKQVRIIEVLDEEEIKEEVEINLDIEIVEETMIEEVVFEEPIIEEKVEEVLTFVEQKPLFVGGDSGFAEFVKKNLSYPNIAQRQGIEGRVFVEFIVEKDGSLSNIGIMKGIGGGCDKEAIRLMQKSPLWVPGKQRGRPVRVHVVIPILFKFE